MRLNQVTITIERYGEQASNNNRETITAYADSNNVSEALMGALYKIQEAIGNPATASSCTNENWFK